MHAGARRAAFGLSLTAAAILHGALLGGLSNGAGPALPMNAMTLQVRTLHAARPVAPDPPRRSAVPSGRDVPPHPESGAPRKPTGRTVPRQRTVPPDASSDSTAAAAAGDAIDSAPSLSSPAQPPDSAVELARESSGPGTTVSARAPRYATVIPPPATLRFRVTRGASNGAAQLRWRPMGERYEARLEASVAGVMMLVQVSEGGFDDTGIAPQRFVDRRARRGALAVNFQREAGRVSFSSREFVLALGAGTQDRLSWIVQLAAIASAQPRLGEPGSRIVIPVVGVRGESAWWQFVCQGEEAVGTPVARAYRFQRSPDGPYDTQVDIWLDAQPPHWPLRASLHSGPLDPGLELTRANPPVPE
jgi:hypothetical protein